MIIKGKMFLLLLITVNLIFICGCWDIREINEIGLVTAVAIDKGDSPDTIAITVQIANPNSENSGSGQGSAKSEQWTGTAEGPSIFDATRKLVKISSRRIMWAHNSVVIIGDSLAKEGIIPIVDFFTHNPELRMKAIIVIADGKAKDYIDAKIGMDTPSGLSFISMASYRELSAESVQSRMLEVSSALKSEHTNPIISKVRLKDDPNQAQSSDSKGGGGENSKIVELSGAAIFKKDKMLGWLSGEESRGVAWILNQTKNTVVTVKDPGHENKSVAVETRDVKAKIKTELVNGTPKIYVNVSGDADIVEEDQVTNESISEMKEHITKLLNNAIKDEIKNSLEVVQNKYGVDCLGFAAYVHAQNPKEWPNIGKKWEDIFPQIPFSVSVNIEIKTSTLNQQPMHLY